MNANMLHEGDEDSYDVLQYGPPIASLVYQEDNGENMGMMTLNSKSNIMPDEELQSCRFTLGRSCALVDLTTKSGMLPRETICAISKMYAVHSSLQIHECPNVTFAYIQSFTTRRSATSFSH